MEEHNTDKQARHSDLQGDSWMLPSAALDRFEPPPNMALTPVVEKEAGRYGFKIGSLGLLIQKNSGSEVIQMPVIWSLPGAPPWFMGLINLRGNLVPVFDLRQVLGLEPAKPGEKPLVLIFDQGEKAVGVTIVDFPKPLTALAALPNLPMLPTALNGHVRQGYIKDEMIWLEFDQQSFFDELVRNTPAHDG